MLLTLIEGCYSSGIDSNRSFQYIDLPEVIAVVANLIDSRPADIMNSKRLSRPSGPCSGSSSVLFRFNTESYGENGGAWRLKNTPAGRRKSFDRTNEPLHSPNVFSVSARIHCVPIVFPASLPTW